jgi:SAM-dependent methyltransferase
MSQPAWSLELYALQHEIWPAWSDSDAGSNAAMGFLRGWLGLELGARVLDLGCGVGRELVELARLGMRPVGVDISPVLVGRARARIQAAGVDATVAVADLLEPDQPGPFDMLMAWDATLNIFPLVDTIAALRRWLPRLGPRARVCVQQLHEPFWRAVTQPVVFADGLGRTIRRYRVEGGRLLDEVRHEPANGPARELPVQALHFYPIVDLEVALAELGLVELHSVGSDGHRWINPRSPDERSASVITVGRMP